ncbi:MAG: putative nitrogen fixation protein NifT [Rhodospirillales bacterium]|nr:putative nitrogen fixation protein NifT [Rhodospirillales bacterium]
MKVTIGRRGDALSAYVAKKDLEEIIIDMERPEIWGGWVDLANGWRLGLPEMAAETRLPITVEARRISGDTP